MEQKWIITVREMTFETETTCDMCQKNKSTYWIEELATPLCKDCFKELKEEQKENSSKEE